MALLGNFWKRWRSSRVEKKHARRLFMESLEDRSLLAAVLTVSKTDNFTDMGKPVRAGEQNLLYTIRIENTGDADATDISMIDNLPAHTSNGVLNVADAPSGSNAVVFQNPTTGDPRAIGTIGLLHPTEHVDFSFQVAVDSNADLQSVNPLHQIDNSLIVADSATDTVVPGTGLDAMFHHFTATTTEANLAISKTANPTGPVHAGDSITYTIMVTNAGPSDSPPVATGINMQDQVPTGINGLTVTSFVLTSYNGLSGPLPPTDWVKAGDTFSNTNAIPNGATATFTMVVKVPDFAPDGTVKNVATITGQLGDPDLGQPGSDDMAMVSTQVIGVQAPDILVTKTGPANPVIAGQDMQYTILVKNQGNQPAPSAVLQDIVPANTTFVSMSPIVGWNLSTPSVGGTGTVTAAADHSLAAGEMATFTLTVHVNPAATTDTKITNTASVAQVTGELDASNNSSTVENNVENDADITITKDDGLTTVNAGDTVTYTITVKNTGPSDVVATNEQQRLTLGGNTSGSFTLTFDNGTSSTTTGSIQANSATLAADIQTALNSLSSMTSVGGSVTVTSSGSNVFTITFGGSLVNQNVNQIVASGAGGTTVTMDTIVGGSGFVTIADTFPADLTNVTFSSTPSGGATGSTSGSGNINDNVNMPANSMVVYTVTGKVNPATSATQLSNTATATVPSGVVDATSTAGVNSATDTDDITKSADISVSIADSADPTTPNQDLVYTYTVTNNGPSNSGEVDFQTTVPVNTNFVSFDLTGAPGWVADAGNPAAGAAAGAMVKALVPDMAPGATATIKMTVHTSASINVATTITNTAQVFNGLDGAQGNNSDTETTLVVPPQPDIAVTKNGPASGIAGQTLTYTINIVNSGFVPANTVVLRDIIPTNTTFVSFSKTSGSASWSVSPSPVSGAAQASISQLDVNDSATFQFVVRVNAADTAAITNTATGTISNQQTDFNTANNSASVTTPINTQADVSVTKSDSPDPVIVGSNLTYTITVNNSGPSNAASVVLTDAVPANTTFVSMSQPAGWTVNTPGVGNTGNVTATRSTLAPSSPTTFTLVVKVNGSTPNNTTITNTASVATATNQNGATANDTATTQTTALAQLDFGDAPNSYGTLFANDGARHVLLNGLHLGAGVDFEIEGQPNATATGDDTNGIDDEDGVTLPAAFIAGRAAAAIVNASATGKLDAWIDFGHDGHFDPSDRIADSLVVSPGNNTLHFTVPADAVDGGTYARFRISTAGGLGPTGGAADGEVEDYATQIIFVAPGSVGVLPNPELPGKSQLSIEGTAGNDSVTVTQLRSPRLLLQVMMNGVNRGTFSMANYQSIVVYAGAGDDAINIKPGMQSFVHGEEGNDKLTTAGGYDDLFGGPGNDTLNSGAGNDYLEGDEGNDTLIAGSGNDLLFGGDGNDSMSGGSGRDILIGGLGVDRESGDTGEDILIGGTTAYDNNRNAVNQLMAIWGSTNTYANRVSSLSPLLNAGTVMDDGATDRLDGGSDKDHDWFFDFLAADTIVNFNAKYDRKN